MALKKNWCVFVYQDNDATPLFVGIGKSPEPWVALYEKRYRFRDVVATWFRSLGSCPPSRLLASEITRKRAVELAATEAKRLGARLIGSKKERHRRGEQVIFDQAFWYRSASEAARDHKVSRETILRHARSGKNGWEIYR